MKIIICLLFMIGPAMSAAAGSMEVAGAWNACLDTVWQTVNDNHYDSTFGGVDWNSIYMRYRTKVDDIKDDQGFMRVVNEMLQELNLSHNSVFMTKDKAASGSPLMSEGSLGLDIRLLDNRVVVTRVTADFPAALAGLRPGFIIESIDDVSISRIMEEAAVDLPSYLNERGRLNTIGDEIVNHFFGIPDTPIKLAYRDADNSLHEQTMNRKARSGKTIVSEDLPPLFLDFSARRLPGDIGYISFSAFLPPAAERFIASVDSMPNLRGLIIDIRGNPGGSHEIGESIASKLVREETLFSIFKFRDSTQEVSVKPEPPTFDGPVVILINVMNGSASERFSACMQSIGRAVIIGERSPGIVGPSDIKILPNGASFMYLVAQSLTPDGTVLEGYGVIPDVTVDLKRKKLLEGVDTQLQYAVDYIGRVSE